MARKVVIRKSALVIFLFLGAAATSQKGLSIQPASPSMGFKVERIPAGGEITLPQPATSYVELSKKTKLRANDKPQTVKLKAVNMGPGGNVGLRVAILEKGKKQIRYVDVEPNATFLYQFENLNDVDIIAEKPVHAKWPAGADVKLQLESDKPLTVGQ